MITPENDPRKQAFDGLTDREIGERLGCSPKMVWKWRTKAERKLRVAIEDAAKELGLTVREFLFGD